MSMEQLHEVSPEPEFRSLSTLEAPRGGRSLKDYEQDLGFKKEDLNTKEVLDLGSGESERLARELKSNGITANVVSLNPDYVVESYERYRKAYENFPGREKGKSVAAIGQNLPFKDESFDAIFALWSISEYLQKEDELEKAFREVYRVLKPGGTARISPFSFRQTSPEGWPEGTIYYLKGNPESYESKWSKTLPGAELKLEFVKVEEGAFRVRLVIKKPE